MAGEQYLRGGLSVCVVAMRDPTCTCGTHARYTSPMGYKTYTCTTAATCGGCETLAVPYPIQLRRKQDQMRELFADLLGACSEDALRPIVGM